MCAEKVQSRDVISVFFIIFVSGIEISFFYLRGPLFYDVNGSEIVDYFFNGVLNF